MTKYQHMNKLTPATPEDLPVLATVHKKVYSSEHFTSNFSHALLEAYYGSFFGSQCFIIKFLQNENNLSDIRGFVVFGADIPGRIKSFKRNHRFPIYWTVLRNPLAAFRKIAETIYHRLFGVIVPFQQCPFLILSIASDRSVPKIGASLLGYSKEMAQSLNYDTIGLYVRVSNINAISFYLNNGFKIMGYESGQFYMEAKI